MRNSLVIRLLLLLAFALTACGQRTVRVVDTVPALLALPASTTQPDAIVAGSGGGQFKWVAGSTAATNTADVFAREYGAASGRWIRQPAIGGTIELGSTGLIFDGNLTNTFELGDISTLTLDGTDSGLYGVKTLFLDGGITTLRGITNLNIITPAVHGGTATAGQYLKLTDAVEGGVEFVSLTNSVADGFSVASGRFEPPPALGWTTAYPLQAAQLPNGDFAALINPRDLVNPAIWTGTAYYVSTTGSDSANGTSAATAVRSIWKAVELGNAAGAPFRVMIAAGSYRMTNSINGYPPTWSTPPSAALKEPTQPCAFIAYGGRVEHSTMKDVASFPVAKDGTYTNCYAISGCEGTRRVFDRLTVDAFGNFTELTGAADLASCNSTTNSWVQSGGTLYINRADAVAPTFANTLTLQNTYTASFLSCTTDLYFEGIDFYGGNSGALHVDPTSTRNVVAADCSFKYAGTSSIPISGVRVRRINGVAAFFRCVAEANTTDGFNAHADGAVMYFLTSQCRAIDNGRYSNTSCNGWTTHDDVIGIDVGGYYGPNNDGAVVHSIETTKSWMLGTTARRSSVCGVSGNSAFKVSNTGVMWLEHCQAFAESGSVASIYVQSAAAVVTNLSSQIFTGIVTQEGGTTYATVASEHPLVYPRNVLYAVSNPTTGDDLADGYLIGSRWFNIATRDGFVATGVTAGSAVWRPMPRNADVQIFTSSGTWTKPAWAVTGTEATTVILVGAGGGGGGGGRYGAGVATFGGGGGGSGGLTIATVSTADLASTVTVTIGAAGTAGVSAGSDSSAGGAGGTGGTTTFGSWRAVGGGGGAQGTSTTGAGGSAGTGGLGGGAGGAGGGSSGTGVASTGSIGVMAGGGGGGGGITTADAAQNGGAGGTPGSIASYGGTAGVAGGAAPSSGTTGFLGWIPLSGGGGGGGGASSGAGVAGAAASGYGAGGGGGGGSRNGNASGAGSAGGAGYCVAITRR